LTATFFVMLGLFVLFRTTLGGPQSFHSPQNR
jgi:hypothetical protein